jgi:hypothetical protein
MSTFKFTSPEDSHQIIPLVLLIKRPIYIRNNNTIKNKQKKLLKKHFLIKKTFIRLLF